VFWRSSSGVVGFKLSLLAVEELRELKGSGAGSAGLGRDSLMQMRMLEMCFSSSSEVLAGRTQNGR
jgi:hypothetical protein